MTTRSRSDRSATRDSGDALTGAGSFAMAGRWASVDATAMPRAIDRGDPHRSESNGAVGNDEGAPADVAANEVVARSEDTG